jgi:hypothetical protein
MYNYVGLRMYMLNCLFVLFLLYCPETFDTIHLGGPQMTNQMTNIANCPQYVRPT